MGRATQSAREKTAMEKVGVMMWPSWAQRASGLLGPCILEPAGPWTQIPVDPVVVVVVAAVAVVVLVVVLVVVVVVVVVAVVVVLVVLVLVLFSNGWFQNRCWLNVRMQRCCSLPATRQAIGSLRTTRTNAALTTPVHYALAEGRHHFFQVLLPFLGLPSCFFRSRSLRSQCS